MWTSLKNVDIISAAVLLVNAYQAPEQFNNPEIESHSFEAFMRLYDTTSYQIVD